MDAIRTWTLVVAALATAIFAADVIRSTKLVRQAIAQAQVTVTAPSGAPAAPADAACQAGSAAPPSPPEILSQIRSRVTQNPDLRGGLPWIHVTQKQMDDFLDRQKGQPYTIAKKVYWDLFDIAVMAIRSETVKKEIAVLIQNGNKVILPKAERVRFFMNYYHIALTPQIFLTWSAVFEFPKVHYNGKLLNTDILLYPLSDPEREGIDGRSYLAGERTWLGTIPAQFIPPSWNGQTQKYLNGEEVVPRYFAGIEEFIHDHKCSDFPSSSPGLSR